MQRSVLPSNLSTASPLASLAPASPHGFGTGGTANVDASQASAFSQVLREARWATPPPSATAPQRPATSDATPTPAPAPRAPERTAPHDPATARHDADDESPCGERRRADAAARRPNESTPRRPAQARAAHAAHTKRESGSALPADARAKTAGSSCSGPGTDASTAAADLDPKHRARTTQDEASTRADGSLAATADLIRQTALPSEALSQAGGRAGHHGAPRTGADGTDNDDLAAAGGAGTRGLTALTALSARSATSGDRRDPLGGDATSTAARPDEHRAAGHGAANPTIAGIGDGTATGAGATAASVLLAQSEAAALLAPAAAQAAGRGGESSAAGDSAPLLAALAGASALASAQAPGTANDGLREGTLHAAPGSEAFAHELGAQVSVFVRDGVQQARLQLNPQDLGPVFVNIQIEGQTAHVHLAAELEPTRHALEQALPALAGQLSESGITLTGGGVFEQRSGSFGTGNGPPDRRDDSGDPAGFGAVRGNGSALAEPPIPARWERLRGIVDLVA